MIDKYVNEYIDFLQDDRHLSNNTIMSYNRDLKIFFRYLKKEGIKNPQEVNKIELRKYLNEMTNKKKSNATLLRYIATIKSYFSYLIDVNVCTKNPANEIETPKVEKKPPQYIKEEDVMTIINMPNTQTNKGIRDRAILSTLYYSGMRVSELISLNTGQFDSESGIIKISGKSKREVKVPKMCIKCLNNYILKSRPEIVKDNDDTTLFLNMKGYKMTRQGLWKIIKYYCKDMNCDYKITPHTFRHSIATNMLLKGEDINKIKKMLGHVDIYSTMVYRK